MQHRWQTNNLHPNRKNRHPIWPETGVCSLFAHNIQPSWFMMGWLYRDIYPKRLYRDLQNKNLHIKKNQTGGGAELTATFSISVVMTSSPLLSSSTFSTFNLCHRRDIWWRKLQVHLKWWINRIVYRERPQLTRNDMFLPHDKVGVQRS